MTGKVGEAAPMAGGFLASVADAKPYQSFQSGRHKAAEGAAAAREELEAMSAVDVAGQTEGAHDGDDIHSPAARGERMARKESGREALAFRRLEHDVEAVVGLTFDPSGSYPWEGIRSCFRSEADRLIRVQEKKASEGAETHELILDDSPLSCCCYSSGNPEHMVPPDEREVSRIALQYLRATIGLQETNVMKRHYESLGLKHAVFCGSTSLLRAKLTLGVFRELIEYGETIRTETPVIKRAYKAIRFFLEGRKWQAKIDAGSVEPLKELDGERGRAVEIAVQKSSSLREEAFDSAKLFAHLNRADYFEEALTAAQRNAVLHLVRSELLRRQDAGGRRIRGFELRTLLIQSMIQCGVKIKKPIVYDRIPTKEIESMRRYPAHVSVYELSPSNWRAIRNHLEATPVRV